ncbi:hypothetical protein Tco_0345613 [Tanacetum coccineum]
MPVQTRRQLATDPKMCMFALTVSIVEPKNIKEAMADSAWIEAMQDELHQFDRLKVWELVDKPFGKMIINLKWLWKNKKDEDETHNTKSVSNLSDGHENAFLNGPLTRRGFGCIARKGSLIPNLQKKSNLLWKSLVSWMSKKQNCTAMSSAEAEYMALSASCHKVVRLGINPMIQPELKDLPKDNPKLEIAVLRIKKKCMDKGSKESSPPHNLGRNRVNTYAVRITMLIANIEDNIMDPVMQCTTLPSHSGFSQKKLVSFVTEIHTTSIDLLTPS